MRARLELLARFLVDVRTARKIIIESSSGGAWEWRAGFDLFRIVSWWNTVGNGTGPLAFTPIFVAMRTTFSVNVCNRGASNLRENRRRRTKPIQKMPFSPDRQEMPCDVTGRYDLNCSVAFLTVPWGGEAEVEVQNNRDPAVPNKRRAIYPSAGTGWGLL